MFGFLKKVTEKEVFCSAVVPAAGSSRRMGGENKLLSAVQGVPVLVHTILALVSSPAISEIILAVREEDLIPYADLCRPFSDTKPIKLVVGGDTRAASVMAALKECSEKASLVAVHDAARPLVTREIIEDTIALAKKTNAAAPAVPVKDTIKIAVDGIIEGTPDRSTLFAVQTPQVFDKDLLMGALQSALDKNLSITDDCSAVERMGKKVYLSEGSYENIKITTPEDLVIAEAILDKRGGI